MEMHARRGEAAGVALTRTRPLNIKTKNSEKRTAIIDRVNLALSRLKE